MRDIINDPPPVYQVVLAQRRLSRPCLKVIPAMLSKVEDHGSYWRGWVGTAEVVLFPQELLGWEPMPKSLPKGRKV